MVLYLLTPNASFLKQKKEKKSLTLKVTRLHHWVAAPSATKQTVAKRLKKKQRGGSADPEAQSALRNTLFPLSQHGQEQCCCVVMSTEMVELPVKTAQPQRSAGVLQQNRVFLDFFWDLAKPDQEVRLKAVEELIQYLKTNNKVRHTVTGSGRPARQ